MDMASLERPIPQLGEISRTAAATEATMPVRELLELFRGDSAMLTVPVIQNGSFMGMISRKGLFNLMSRPFTMELYAKKPVSVLLDDLPGENIIMAPGLDVNMALAELLAMDPELSTDVFPIVEEGRCVGVVLVPDLMMAVSKSQKQLLEALDRLSARIREEVSKASEIQQALLPLPEFQFGDISVGAGITTSSEIGGDFYDYFTLGDKRLGLVIGDVSGHGVQSGMVTTAAKASLHTLIAQGITTPAALLHGMNHAILATARQTLLMTCLIAVIEPAENRLTFANAGHNFPYLHRGKEARLELIQDVSGFPLGFEKDSLFTEFSTGFSEGDSLCLYTDGLVECTGENGEEFGYGRLEEALAENILLTPSSLRKTLMEKTSAFTGAHSLEDDVTILIAAFQKAHSN